MPRQKQAICTNCNGENEKCKYLETGRKCRKGKAKGKAVSQATIDKRDNYDSLLGNLHTDYLNSMRNRQIRKFVDKETGEIVKYEHNGKVNGFVRYLNQRGETKLASWFRRNYKSQEEFNFKDFDNKGDYMTNDMFLEILVLGNTDIIILMIKNCTKNGQEYMDNYITKIKDMINDYKKRGINTKKYEEQYNVLAQIKMVERAKEYLNARREHLINEPYKKLKN